MGAFEPVKLRWVPQKAPTLLICSFALALYAVAATLGIRVLFPVLPAFDNAHFMGLSWSLLNGHGLENRWLHPLGGGVFNWHGVIHPWLLAALSPSRTWAGVGTGAGAISALVALFTLAIAWTMRLTPPVMCVAVLCVVAISLGFGARPESTAALLTLAILAVQWRWPFDGPLWGLGAILSGLLFGILLAAHVAAFILVGIVFAIAAALAADRTDQPLVRIVMIGSVVGGLSAFTYVVAVSALYPHDVRTLIDGLIAHSAKTLGRGDGTPLMTYWVFARFTPLAVIPLILCAGALAIALALAWRSRRSRFTVPFAAGLSLLLGYAVWVTSFRLSDTFYNAFVLFPAGLLMAAYIAEQSGRLGRMAYTGLGGVFAIAGMAAQLLFLSHAFLSRPGADEARRALRAEITAAVGRGERVLADAMALAALEQPDWDVMTRATFLAFPEPEIVAPDPQRFDTIVRVQHQHGERTPARIPGYSLVRDHYEPLRGFAMNRPVNLSFAVWRSDLLPPLPGAVR